MLDVVRTVVLNPMRSLGFSLYSLFLLFLLFLFLFYYSVCTIL